MTEIGKEGGYTLYERDGFVSHDITITPKDIS